MLTLSFGFIMNINNRVLMLTCQYMPDVYGGAEKQCQRISQELSKDHSVTILTSCQRYADSGHGNEGKVRVRRLYSIFPPDLLGRWLPFSFIWFVSVLFWTIKNRKSFNIIHCHQGKFGAFVGVFIGWALRKPVLIKVGNSGEYMDLRCLEGKKFIGPLLASFVLRHQPLLVAITEQIENELRGYGFNNVVVIHNSISSGLSCIDKQVEKTNRSHDCINLFYHGRIESIKDIPLLIEAFSLVRKSKPMVLNVIGDGTKLTTSKAYAEELGLMDSVVFHGELDDVISFINEFDVFVNSSQAEGFSNSLLEALLLGKILVSTPVSGADDAIENGVNGFVSNSHKAHDIATAILNAIKLYELDSGEVAKYSKTLIANKFESTVIANNYRELYAGM
jgi:glycosyltransferase involved in cell wall biosynthesis